MCKCCILGINGRIVCVLCTPTYVNKFVTENYTRYQELYRKIIQSLCHKNNTANAIAIYEQHNSNLLDTQLIEMIVSLAIYKQIENRKYITIQRSQV